MIFFIYGTDHYRCQQKSQELKNQFIEKRDKTGLNVVQLDGERLHFEKFQQEALTTPFLSEKKMLVVKNAVQNKKLAGEIHDFLKDRSEKLITRFCFWN